MTKTQIHIPNQWLSPGYYVYVAHITYKQEAFLYIGQTGDNNYPVARGPLYRICGHITQQKSTQNQIIKGLQKHLSIGDDKQATASILPYISLDYDFYKIHDFDPADHPGTHTKKRKETQFIEHWLIYQLQKNKAPLFNKSVKTAISAGNQNYFGNDYKHLETIAASILKDLKYEE